MSNKLGQWPAFPLKTNWVEAPEKNGMSKRYLTAKDCLCAMLTNIQFLEANANAAKKQFMKADEYLVFTAYSLADELLKQENQ